MKQKTLFSRVAFFFVLYFFITFVCVWAVTAAIGVEGKILPIFERQYLINDTLLNYFSIFVSLQISSIMVELSWAFSKESDEETVPKPADMLKHLKNVFIIIVANLFLFIVATEFIEPVLTQRQRSMQNASLDFVDFTKRAEENLAAKNYSHATLYAQQALRIAPESPEAIALMSKIESAASHYESMQVPPAPVEEETKIELNIPVPDLIKRAKEAYKKGEYFEAHYYATLAQESYNTSNANLKEAKAIAEDAWTKMQVTNTSMGMSEALYSQKKQGYGAIVCGDYLRAYYIFRELLNGIGSDPDVDRYLKVAEENIANQVFFTDETMDLQPFESVRDVHFAVDRPDGGKIFVAFKGITSVQKGKVFAQYARGMHIASYDEYHNLEESFYVPYAKLQAENAENLGYIYEAAVDKAKDKRVPYFIIKAVDRNERDNAIEPVVHYRAKTAVVDKTVYILPMPFNDFLEITEATKGAKLISLGKLISFCGKASKYGFEEDVFWHALVSRLCMPFLFLIVAMIATIFAWKFKLKNSQLVHFWWLLFVPAFTLLMYFILRAVDYFHRILLCALIGVLNWVALPVCVCEYLLVFTALCVYFVSIKDKAE